MNKTPVIINPERETRGFFWFMTAILAGVSVSIIVSQPEMRQPLRLISFSVLMAIHIALHWQLRRYVENQRLMIAYVVVQGLLAAIMMLITHAVSLVYGVSMGLIGEAIGVYGITRRGLLAAAYYLVLSVGLFLWISNIKMIGWWLLATIPMLIFVVVYVELYSRQVNANLRAQELLNNLDAANRQLTEYAAQVEDLSIAAERQRMARELHDTLSQGLAGLILQLEAADAHLVSGRTEKARQIIQQTMESARSTLANARRAIDDLREINSTDCEEALQAEISRFRNSTGVPCAFEIDLPSPLPPSLSDPIVRIVKEGLANIAHHARATQASVRLKPQDGALTLEIGDNGSGFDPAAVPAGHYGLIGMRERARLAGWDLQIKSDPGTGTTITVRIPNS